VAIFIVREAVSCRCAKCEEAAPAWAGAASVLEGGEGQLRMLLAIFANAIVIAALPSVLTSCGCSA
jgi:hypothetical protein